MEPHGARSLFDSLQPAMQRAIALAWESARAGSLGVGAVVSAGDGSAGAARGTILTTGRNRLHEVDGGPDPLAGSSLAHAELNALSKLRYRAHEDDNLELHTTLQPCVQCLGAIRLAPIRRVLVLAPDPLWVGLEAMAELTPFLARNWPTIEFLPPSGWSAFGLLFPTIHSFGRSSFESIWAEALPTFTTLISGWADDRTLSTLIADEPDVVSAAEVLWPGLCEAATDLVGQR